MKTIFQNLLKARETINDLSARVKALELDRQTLTRGVTRLMAENQALRTRNMELEQEHWMFIDQDEEYIRSIVAQMEKERERMGEIDVVLLDEEQQLNDWLRKNNNKEKA